ncbi:SDR family NAD(P)-dependent oxidoreductase [Paenibacillus marinisediminis]
MNWNGAVIVVTGASSGIGALIAQYAADKGAYPILVARSLDKLKQVSSTISAPHECIQMDVRDAGQVSRQFQYILEKHGRVDILVNNAGFGLFERELDLELEHYEAMMDVNYMGVVRCTKAVLPSMLARRSGHIVNIASMAGKVGSAKSTAYAASKHAVLGYTNSLRMELSGSGVAVSAVNPGPIDTPFFDTADPSGSYKSNLGKFIMPPEKVARHVIRVMETRKPEVNLPWMASAGTKLMQLFPRLTSRAAERVLNKK